MTVITAANLVTIRDKSGEEKELQAALFGAKLRRGRILKWSVHGFKKCSLYRLVIWFNIKLNVILSEMYLE